MVGLAGVSTLCSFSFGWAFSILGIGGLGAWLAAIYYALTRKSLLHTHS
jgi:hypothetical protein